MAGGEAGTAEGAPQLDQLRHRLRGPRPVHHLLDAELKQGQDDKTCREENGFPPEPAQPEEKRQCAAARQDELGGGYGADGVGQGLAGEGESLGPGDDAGVSGERIVDGGED